MTRIIVIVMGLLVVGGCSPTSEEKTDSGHPVAESSNPLPIEKSMNEQAAQLRKSSNELQKLLNKWEAKQ